METKRRLFQCMESVLKEMTVSPENNQSFKQKTLKCQGKQMIFKWKLEQLKETASAHALWSEITSMCCFHCDDTFSTCLCRLSGDLRQMEQKLSQKNTEILSQGNHENLESLRQNGTGNSMVALTPEKLEMPKMSILETSKIDKQEFPSDLVRDKNYVMSSQGKSENTENEHDYKDFEWSFVKICIQMLLYLKEYLNTEEKKMKFQTQRKEQHKPNIVGVNDEKLVAATLQLVSVYGLWCFFQPGIGKPLPTKLSTDMVPEKRENRNEHFIVLQCLLSLLENKTLNGLVMSHLCTDILASLIQLGFEPTRQIEIETNKLCLKQRKFCRTRLHEFVSRSYQPLVVKEMLLLQKSFQSSFQSTKKLQTKLNTVPPKRPSKWYMSVIGNQLSQCIMAEKGVKNVLQAVFSGMPEQMSWKHYESIGKLISSVPSQITSSEEYYKLISKQILELLTTRHDNIKYKFIYVCTITQMIEQHFQLVKIYLFDPMMHCLNKMLSHALVVLQESEVRGILIALKTLICLNDVIVPDVIYDIITSIGHPLFLLSCVASNNFNEFRKSIQEILVALLKQLPREKSFLLVSLFVMGKVLHKQKQDQNIPNIKPVKEGLKIIIKSVKSQKRANNEKNSSRDQIHPVNDDIPSATTNENLSCEKPYPINEDVYSATINGNPSHEQHYPISDVSLEERINRTVEILNAEGLEGLRGDVFVSVLEQLVEEVTRKSAVDGSDSRKELILIDRKFESVKQNIELLSFMSALIDIFGHSVLQNTPQIVSFVKGILEWSQKQQKHTSTLNEKDDVTSFHDSTIDLVLMLLSTLLGSDQLTASDYEELQQLLPSLETTSRHHRNSSSRAMASDIKLFISLRGNVPSSSLSSDKNTTQNMEEDLSSLQCYQKALEELSDSLLPTRGHGLRQLSKLLNLRNKYAVNDEERLFRIFESQLKHEDTYLYLAAVDGLTSLVDVHHRKVMPMLCTAFVSMHTDVFNETASHNRMKLCEAIIRSCKLCGDMLPMYKELLTSAFLCGVKDEDELIRASCFSALGDLCRMLKYSIGFMIDEVFDCIRHVVSTDTSCEVRKASVQVLSDILKGLDTSVFKVIPDSLVDIYKLLKVLKITEKDKMTTLHIDNSLTILDEIVHSLFNDGMSKQRIIVM